jgi:GT2 family glycosyltransferase
MYGNNSSVYFSLIVCTYQRSKSLVRLLDSVSLQCLYPNEILIIDASKDDITENSVNSKNYRNLSYYKVAEESKGLTRQRNFGIKKLSPESEIICFLDDDIVLDTSYFKKIIETYLIYPKAVAVGGLIVNESNWKRLDGRGLVGYDEYSKDGYVRKLGRRNLIRKYFNLLSNKPPGFMPSFSHGLSISFLPPSDKIYPVEFFMGGVSSYKKELFSKLKFSEYFEGYGLYEDLDFCLRASKLGDLFVNTGAHVDHLHDEAGRPDYFKYGKMVVRNGYYVWKQKYPDPDYKSILKWNTITLLLAAIRLSNIINSNDKFNALNESLGRFVGWLTLLVNTPKTM